MLYFIIQKWDNKLPDFTVQGLPGRSYEFSVTAPPNILWMLSKRKQ